MNFDWINPLYAYLGLAGMGIAGALAVAYFFPPFRKAALAVAAGIAGVAAIYRKGAKDASERAERQRKAEETAAIKRGHDARTNAERDVARGVRDKFDREQP